MATEPTRTLNKLHAKALHTARLRPTLFGGGDALHMLLVEISDKALMKNPQQT
jgi:hypothetical protein